MSKKENKSLELGYTIEAQEDEIDWLRAMVENLKGVNAEKQERIVELITENDRLTLTYEPYNPPTSSLKERLIEINKKYSVCASFDFWPLSDWGRLKLYKWNPGHAFQLNIGPLRLDVFEN